MDPTLNQARADNSQEARMPREPGLPDGGFVRDSIARPLGQTQKCLLGPGAQEMLDGAVLG